MTNKRLMLQFGAVFTFLLVFLQAQATSHFVPTTASKATHSFTLNLPSAPDIGYLDWDFLASELQPTAIFTTSQTMNGRTSLARPDQPTVSEGLLRDDGVWTQNFTNTNDAGDLTMNMSVPVFQTHQSLMATTEQPWTFAFGLKDDDSPDDLLNCYLLPDADLVTHQTTVNATGNYDVVLNQSDQNVQVIALVPSDQPCVQQSDQDGIVFGSSGVVLFKVGIKNFEQYGAINVSSEGPPILWQSSEISLVNTGNISLRDEGLWQAANALHQAEHGNYVEVQADRDDRLHQNCVEIY